MTQTDKANAVWWRQPAFGRVIVAALAAALAIHLGFSTVAPLAAIESWLQDFRTVWIASPAAETADVVVVEIGDEDLDQRSSLVPLDRPYLAGLLQRILQAGPKAVGLDLPVIDGPGRTPCAIAEEEPVTPCFWDLIRETDRPLTLLAPPKRWGADGADNPDYKRAAQIIEELNNRMVKLAESGMVADDSDGVIRYALAEVDGEPSFAASLARVALGSAPIRLVWQRESPTNPLIRIPARGLIASDASTLVQRLKDKTVLLGLGTVRERRLAAPERTPLDRMGESGVALTPAVEIEARAVAQFLNPSSSASAARNTVIAVLSDLIAAGVGIAVIVGLGDQAVPRAPRRAPAALSGILPPVMLLIVLLGLGVVAGDTSLPILPPTLSLVIGEILAGLAYRRWRLREQLVEATILFTDLAGFTTASSKQETGSVAVVLNDYLKVLVGAVHEHRGTIANYTGDGIMAIWNAPEEQTDHTARAIACARAIQERSRAFVTAMRHRNFPLGETRIGIHTGFVRVGRFGPPGASIYTAIGDAANTAARLESANKLLKTQIAISKSTVARWDDPTLVPVAAVKLRGRESQGTAEPIPSEPPDPDERLAGTIEVFTLVPDGCGTDALTEYRAAYLRLRRGDGSGQSLFAPIKARFPACGLANLHADSPRDTPVLEQG